MILSLLLNSSKGNVLQSALYLLISIPLILLSLTLHEVAHGYIAYKCGDDTAKMMGRLSINPLKHLDLFGSLMMLFIGFGYAKPVPVNYRKLRKPRRDIALVSIAGPLTNILIGFICVLILYSTYKITFLPESVASTVQFIFYLFAFMNFGLGVFNLIPIPPFDGSKILSSFLPPLAAAKYLRLEYYSKYLFIFLIALFWLPYPFDIIGDWLLYPITWSRTALFNIFSDFAIFIFGL